MSPEWRQRVHRVMDHVRDHPREALTLDELSRVAHSSPFHFHRIFKAVAGETLAAFTRRTRLERAAYLMKARPDRSLSSIALEVGFPSSSEFTRVFSRLYGVAPSRWDRVSRLATPEGRAPSRSAPGDAVPPAPPRVVEHDAIRLLYVRVRATFGVDALAPALERLLEEAERRGLPWREARLVGMSWDNYETTPMDRLQYDLGLTVGPDVTAEGEFGIRELPALRAVEIECEGPLLNIANAWDHLYERWFPASSFEPADLPAMKRWRVSPADVDWTDWRVSCSIALRRARA